MTQQLVKAQTFAVTFLSPVHIGTEEQLSHHDFLCENTRLIRFRINPILERMNEGQLERFVEEGLEGVKEWIRRLELWQSARLYEASVPRPPRPFRESLRPFIADPLFRPYLPGTEIKGAIRTAIAWWLLRQLPNLRELQQRVGKRQHNNRIDERDRRQAGQWLERGLLGDDPNHDLLRGLRVQDSNPVAPARLRVFPVLVAVRTNRGLQWLQSPRSKNQPSQYTDDHQRAIANFCECVDERVQGVRISVVEDAFLSDGEIGKGDAIVRVAEELRWEQLRRQAFAQWRQACNELAKTVAAAERDWRGQVKGNARNAFAQLVAARLERFYDDLLRRVEAEKDAVFLNLGWGGGWRTKTVTETFGDELVQQVVNRYNLDRGARSRPFPKTRKLAWRGGNEFVPLGWVKLMPQ